MTYGRVNAVETGSGLLAGGGCLGVSGGAVAGAQTVQVGAASVAVDLDGVMPVFSHAGGA